MTVAANNRGGRGRILKNTPKDADEAVLKKYSSFMTDEDLQSFRTEVCPDKKYRFRCPRSNSCPYSHCMSWQRRDPFTVPYQHLLCPHLEFARSAEGTFSVINRCTRKRTCEYSHTKEEQLYHPSVYKTQACRMYPYCTKAFCPFAHGAGEVRDSVDSYFMILVKLGRDTADLFDRSGCTRSQRRLPGLEPCGSQNKDVILPQLNNQITRKDSTSTALDSGPSGGIDRRPEINPFEHGFAREEAGPTIGSQDYSVGFVDGADMGFKSHGHMPFLANSLPLDSGQFFTASMGRNQQMSMSGFSHHDERTASMGRAYQQMSGFSLDTDHGQQPRLRDTILVKDQHVEYTKMTDHEGKPAAMLTIVVPMEKLQQAAEANLEYLPAAFPFFGTRRQSSMLQQYNLPGTAGQMNHGSSQFYRTNSGHTYDMQPRRAASGMQSDFSNSGMVGLPPARKATMDMAGLNGSMEEKDDYFQRKSLTEIEVKNR